jgi:hypothetical protein
MTLDPARLRVRYEDGASIRQLSRATGRSFWWVRTRLLAAGVTLRGRGGDQRPYRF